MKKFKILSALMVLFGTFSLHAESPLEKAVLSAVREAQFDQIIDFGPFNEQCPGKEFCHVPALRIEHSPNVDVAVIQLDEHGKVVDRAEVLLSRDFPKGYLVPLDMDAGAREVRFLRWDVVRWDGGTFSSTTGKRISTKGWTNDPPLTPADDLVPGRTNAAVQFMLPYPASLLKLMVAFRVLRLVDAGEAKLDSPYTFAPPKGKSETRTLGEWMDPMITVSDNHCTSVLLKFICEHHGLDAMNDEYRAMNLPTMQIKGINPEDGGNWQPGLIHMSAFDTARLLLLIDGAPGELWHGADGKAITASYLSENSRGALKKMLLEQGWNEALSTANYPGAPNVRAGIPSQVSERWINPTNGHAIVEWVDFGVDIRELNKNAEVIFAHKTGLTFNYGSDAGVVQSLPGRPFRHYIIAVFGNLGFRFADEVFANRTSSPSADKVSPISYTQKIPALGKAIDDAVTALSKNSSGNK